VPPAPPLSLTLWALGLGGDACPPYRIRCCASGLVQMLSVAIGAMAFSPNSALSRSAVASRSASVSMVEPVIVGIAADSGCGKSTFMRRLTSIFGGESKLLDIGRETNTLVSDMTTVICLDDYHKYDREGRKSNPEFPDGITALAADCQDWDKMAADVGDLKAGKAVNKPIYNHITGALDPNEDVSPTPIVIFEGLHPLVDDRVRGMLDLSVYLDITDDVKFAWKAQRDIAERGATMEDVQAAIDARKPDFAAYVEPQKEKADIIVQVLLSDLVDDPTGSILKVKLIQKKGLVVPPAYFFDEGANVEWVPNPEKLTTKAPGVKIASYSDEWFGQPVSVIEMDGEVQDLEELVYVESHLCSSGTKYYGELSEQMLANKDAPGSPNGTGLFQTVCSFKIREAFEAISK